MSRKERAKEKEKKGRRQRMVWGWEMAEWVKCFLTRVKTRVRILRNHIIWVQ